ncbi:hypothetical protein BDY17DRAFT_58405 [Neohortaea acidophila]|uniref:Zn(2)-C6 fungal-type domain-containing protein n=1 Tax=Neohortaea acidophila TaxID=245834 RepID=A0A6A6PGI0_9PEZI|nr:uncharacterized protein BDY17DRAFT_58405 [Neohortaea acidophila]KAF2478733.1 hypothetical protein BDY17DRAFT_58405 [Neohortaea acidophila]
MTIPLLRRRAKHAKVRTGCRTCRDRHVKCDEQRPTCKRCEDAGKACAGYDAAQVCPPKPQLARQNPTLRSLASFACPLTSREKHAVDFFRLRAIHQMPGSSWLLAWDRLVLPLFQTEPAVLHAAAALASLQRGLIPLSPAFDGVDQAEDLRFALEQYNRTISSLGANIELLEKQRSASAAEAVLVVSLLLFAFELLHGNESRASIHLRGGMKVLMQQLQSTPRTNEGASEGGEVVLRAEPRSLMDLLTHGFVRLDADLSLLAGQSPTLYPTVNGQIPSAFSSLREAAVHLDAIERDVGDTWCEMFKLAEEYVYQSYENAETVNEEILELLIIAKSRTIPLDSAPEVERKTEKITATLTQWMFAFAALPIAGEKRLERILVEAQFFCLWMTAGTWQDEDEQPTDRFLDQCKHMLDSIALYVKRHQAFIAESGSETPETTAQTQPAFAVGTALGPALRVIIERCRDSLLRRQAISLLRGMNMRGVHDAEFLASFYEALVDLEESQARDMLGQPAHALFQCHHIPSAARILESRIGNPELYDDFYHRPYGHMLYITLDAEGEAQAHSQVFFVPRPGSPASVNTVLPGHGFPEVSTLAPTAPSPSKSHT